MEIVLRLDDGESPSPLEYRERFPDDAATVAAAFDRDRSTAGRSLRLRPAKTSGTSTTPTCSPP